MKRTVEDIIEIGKKLTEIKPKLAGSFDAWFSKETGLERTMAYKFMQAHERFGALNYSTLPFTPTILYALAAPSTPDAVVEQALEKAESGEPVTLADVQDWKAKAADLEVALEVQAETIDFFKQQTYSMGEELATARRRQPNSAGVEPFLSRKHAPTAELPYRSLVIAQA